MKEISNEQKLFDTPMLEFQLYSQPGKEIAIHDSSGMGLFHDANLGLFSFNISLYKLPLPSGYFDHFLSSLRAKELTRQLSLEI